MHHTAHIRTAHAPALRRDASVATLADIGWLNLGLGVLALLLLMYYVMQANLATASAWELKEARSELAAAQESRDALVARQATLDDRQTLLDLAAAQGLVPAGAVVYLVQPDAVAAR